MTGFRRVGCFSKVPGLSGELTDNLFFANLVRLQFIFNCNGTRPSQRKERPMAYSVASKKSGRTFYLHKREVTLRGGRKQTIYFFAGTVKEGACDQLPAGYGIGENSKTGLPILKKV